MSATRPDCTDPTSAAGTPDARGDRLLLSIAATAGQWRHRMSEPSAGVGGVRFVTCRRCGLSAYTFRGRVEHEPGLASPCSGTPPSSAAPEGDLP